MEQNSFMRASQLRNSAAGKDDPSRASDSDAMMAEIQKNIKFFNEKDEESVLEEPSARPEEAQKEGNMSFSFAVAAPVEMEQK